MSSRLVSFPRRVTVIEAAPEYAAVREQTLQSSSALSKPAPMDIQLHEPVCTLPISRDAGDLPSLSVSPIRSNSPDVAVAAVSDSFSWTVGERDVLQASPPSGLTPYLSAVISAVLRHARTGGVYMDPRALFHVCIWPGRSLFSPNELCRRWTVSVMAVHFVTQHNALWTTLSRLGNLVFRYIIHSFWSGLALRSQLVFWICTVPHSDTCGAATHSLIIGAGGR